MALYEDVDRQAEEFSLQTGLKCKEGCGACCLNPDIETTVAEVLPLAVHLWSKGVALKQLESIQSKAAKSICDFYEASPLDPCKGRCSIYTYRPGLCRLFGFAAHRDKQGKRLLLTCRVIKNSQPEACQRTQEELDQGLKAPLLTSHACAVSNIDPCHGQKLLPINQAVQEALQKVGFCLEDRANNGCQ